MRFTYFRNLSNQTKRIIRRDNIRGNQKKTVFYPNEGKKNLKIIKPPPIPPSVELKIGPRTNALGIQMVSKQLHDSIFKNSTRLKCSPAILEQSKKSLQKHNMITKESDYTDDINFEIPFLKGENIEDHFYTIGREQVTPYVNIIKELLIGIQPPPSQWIMQEGWTRYVSGCEPEPVSYPLEDGLVFDVEVCILAGKAPTLATAVSNKAWYGWVSQSLLDSTAKPVTNSQYQIDSLIPLESETNDSGVKLNEHLRKPKIVVGHNVSYDRARIKEQYWLEQTGTRFVDTMSLHVCVSGLTSYQRAVLKSGKCDDEDEIWKSQSSLNNLSEVHRLYCGMPVDKETRNIFVEGNLKEINQEFQKVMTYCANDVEATYRVLSKLFPLFQERFPHPVTFAGMLELSTAYLPVNSNWNRYIEESEQTYEDLSTESRLLLARRAEIACQLLEDEKYKNDIWMWDEDWQVKNLRYRKLPKENPVKKATIKEQSTTETDQHDEEDTLLQQKFLYLWDTCKYLSSAQALLPGYPNWYRKLCTKPDSSPDWTPGPHLISTSMRVTPKLLNLTWEGYPLYYNREEGWGFLIPFTDDLELPKKLPLRELIKKCPILTLKSGDGSELNSLNTIAKDVENNLARKEYYSRLKKDKTQGLYKGTGVWCNTVIDDCCYLLRLPHKDGASHRVGNPLSKDFLTKFSENVLAGDTESAEHVLSIARKLSYWRNNRDRIMEQMVVWLNQEHLPKNLRGYDLYGAILPQVVVCGTLTRRAVEPTWMTASNAQTDRLGSELRSMVQAPPGYSIVGADVDAQELWIASIIGDAHFAKMHGATPFGWMTLSGNKADGTDMHSVTAKTVGISRDQAKVLNYARIYGAGQNFAERLLKQFNPSMSDSEARNKATMMFNLTKGKRIYHLKDKYLNDFEDKPYSKWQAFEMAKMHGKTVEEMFLKPKWVGGTESAMFNRLEEIAGSETPITPFLNSRLSRSIEPKLMPGDRFLPTRVNWVVQSGAVDFLHLMLVCMRWLLKDKARFCLSFHDEVRYLVKEDFKYQAALAMHVTNLLTRSFCSFRLGINDLPLSVAFFSSVEVDSVLRKDSKQDCKTPSNPHGLEKGYGIPNGESLDISDAIRKAGGQYKCWYNMDR